MLRALLLFLIVPTWGFAQANIPPLSGPVVDSAGMIPPALEKTLVQLIQKVDASRKLQLQILTINSLGGESIEAYSIRVADQWKLGGSKTDEGVLVLAALQDRKIRIEVGQGLEGVIPDAKAKRIVDLVMVPLLKQGEAGEAFLLGTMAIIKEVIPDFNFDEFGGAWQKGGSSPKSDIIVFLVFVFFIFTMVGAGFVRGHGVRHSGLGYGGHGPFGRGGGFGGGGGGGGWSGRGGGFSGGGASGSW